MTTCTSAFLPSAISSKINAPEYASHFQFIASRVVINFEEGTYKSVVGKTIRMALNQSVTENLQLILPPKLLPGGIDLAVLGIVFSGELKRYRGAPSVSVRGTN